MLLLLQIVFQKATWDKTQTSQGMYIWKGDLSLLLTSSYALVAGNEIDSCLIVQQASPWFYSLFFFTMLAKSKSNVYFTVMMVAGT